MKMTMKKTTKKPRKRNIGDDDLVKIVSKIINSLVSKFRFGYHDLEDMRQQGWVFLLDKVLPKWDRKRPLENFLYRSLRNQYINFKRDNYSRQELPCYKCPFYDPKNVKSVNCNQCSIFIEKMECEKWAAWKVRNDAKKSLTHANEINENSVIDKDDILQNVEMKEMLELIDRKLPLDLRADFIRIKEGVALSAQRREKVKEAVREILNADL